MVGMDGIEASQAIRSTPGGASLPVLGLTANIDQPDSSNFQSAGLNAIMLKPFDRAQWIATLERLLAQHQS